MPHALCSPSALVLFLIGVCLVAPIATVESADQAAGLLKIRDGFLNGGEVLADWGNGSAGPCNWTRVGCDSGQVMYLHLNNLGLQGPLTATGWEQLPWLEFLTLAGNHLTGSLPSEWHLSRGLLVLDLSSNAISGSVPQGWPLPGSLVHLKLGQNKLEGSLPAALPGGLTRLELQGNQFSGKIPGTWELPLLSYAALYDNELSGSLPSWSARGWAEVVVVPQRGQGLCGKVPATPPYYAWGSGKLRKLGCDDLPGCEPAPGAGTERGSLAASRSEHMDTPAGMSHQRRAWNITTNVQ